MAALANRSRFHRALDRMLDTTAAARKAWETRRHGGRIEEPAKPQLTRKQKEEAKHKAWLKTLQRPEDHPEWPRDHCPRGAWCVPPSEKELLKEAQRRAKYGPAPPPVSAVPPPPGYTDLGLIPDESKQDAAAKALRPQVNKPMTLTPAEKKSIKSYGELDFDSMNGGLREGESDWLKDPEVQTLTGLIDKSRTAKDVIVYRGLRDMPSALRKTLTSGGVFTDRGFVSTSLAREAAETFPKGFGDDWVMRIQVPKGSKGYMLPTGDEYELLLQRGSRFKIGKIEKPRKGEEGLNPYIVNMKLVGVAK
jgi:hypothetical protein